MNPVNFNVHASPFYPSNPSQRTEQNTPQSADSRKNTPPQQTSRPVLQDDAGRPNAPQKQCISASPEQSSTEAERAMYRATLRYEKASRTAEWVKKHIIEIEDQTQHYPY